MKGHPRLTLIFAALCLVTACGVKGPPKRPKAKKPPPQTSELKSVPQETQDLTFSTLTVQGP